MILWRNKETVYRDAVEKAYDEFIFGNDRELQALIAPLFEASLPEVYRYCRFRNRRDPSRELAYATAYVAARLLDEASEHRCIAGFKYIILTCRRGCLEMESHVINRLDETGGVFDAVRSLPAYRDTEERLMKGGPFA